MAYDVGTEKRVTAGLQTVWMGSAIWTRWHIQGSGRWPCARKCTGDPDGELTGYQQLIGAITAATEYRLPIGPTSAAFRAEFRHDTSMGPEGGFFNPASVAPALVPGQNLFFFALIWTFDGQR